MKKALFVTLCVLLSQTLAPTARGEVDFIIDARPGTLILSQETADFEVLGPHPTLPLREVEEAGTLSTIPNLKLGVGWSQPNHFLDLTADLGVLVNERFRAIMVGADVSWEYRFRKNVAMGPHLGYAYFADPEWTGDAPVDMDATWGLLGGLQISIGYDVLFVVSLDYLFADPFDVVVSAPWEGSGGEIDMEGLTVQFGIRGRL
ncbi:MAG: hypothetical protein JXB13_00715 [Phycisphaerae bacterium]|nr:hypothetical protein [Phycisphaerae bacterium]